MRIVSMGHAVFAATMLAIGILGLLKGDFAPIWQPVPKDMPVRELLAYGCALVAAGAGFGLYWRRAAGAAARVLLALFLLWMLLFKLPGIVRHPTVEIVYQNWGETAAIAAACWVLYVWCATPWDKRQLNSATGENGLRIARILYGLSLIAFGLSHFAYAKETAAAVPDWLPAHAMWAYFTGCTYTAAGAAILTGVQARWAAALSSLQMGVFTLLVWVPPVLAGPNAEQWSEFVVSWALTAAGWVIADSYRVPRPSFSTSDGRLAAC